MQDGVSQAFYASQSFWEKLISGSGGWLIGAGIVLALAGVFMRRSKAAVIVMGLLLVVAGVFEASGLFG